MYPILAMLVAAAQPTYYEAQVTSFGCLSVKEVHQLQSQRADVEVFQLALARKQVLGQCVVILKGTTVEGSVESGDDAILRVNERIMPPGYEAPLDDFKRRDTTGQK